MTLFSHINDGARYNPTTDTWTPITTTGAPAARNSHTAVWTGGEMIVWGGSSSIGFFNDGGRYIPPPSLTLAMYAGLTIIAPIGSTNQIQYVNDLNNTNWTTLTNLVLPSSPYIFIDYSSPGQPRRFYRDVLVP